jgi:hypothetical protein
MHCLFRHGLYAAAFAALNAGAQPSAASAMTPAVKSAATPAVAPAATQPQAPAASPAPAAPAAQAARRPDPTDASVAVPATPHRTALTGYRRLTDDAPRAWRESNETVARIGGWRTYLREAQAPDPKASEVGR